MASVLHSGNNKGVHFAADIDWKEEDRRSGRGSEARRKKKKAKEMAKNHKEERLRAAFEILQGAQHEDGLVRICEHRLTRNVVSDIIRQDNDENGAPGDYRDGLRRALGVFRASRTTRDDLNRDEVEALAILSGLNRFLTEFNEYMPASVVSSEESSEEEGSGGQRSRGQQNRRDTEQQMENDTKELYRNY
jgi:hypothetical protein